MTSAGGELPEPAASGGGESPSRPSPAELKAIAWWRQTDATAAAVGLAGLIAVLEINRLSTSVLNGFVSRGIGELSTPLAAWKTDVWDHWIALKGQTAVEGADSIAGWIAWSAAFDLLFIAGYAWLLAGLVLFSVSVIARWCLVVLVAAEVTETLLHWVGAALLQWADGVAVPVRVVMVGATSIKWIALLVLVIALLRDPVFRAASSRGLVRVFRALRVQRLSLVIVVAIAALTLVPGPNISDQFPDVVRGWFDRQSPQAIPHLIAGVVAYLLAGVILFVIGRQRSERSWETYVGHPPGNPRPPQGDIQHGLWLVGPAAACVVGLLLTGTGHADLIDVRILLVFILVPLALLILSALARLLPARLRRPEDVSAFDEDRARRTWVTGDLLAAALPVVGALATVRALTAPTILGGARDPEVRWEIRLLFLVLAFGAVVLVFHVVGTVWRHFDVGEVPDGPSSSLWQFLRPDSDFPEKSLLHRPVPILFWVAAVASLVALVLVPLQIAEGIGVIAVTLWALTAWALVVGYLMVHLQHHQPLEIFRALRLRAVPLLTLFAVVPLIASLMGGVEGLHAVRTMPGAGGPPERPSMAQAFHDWLKESEGCDVRVGNTTVRPMVLVAASGGGIRAATWTAGVLDGLDKAVSCGDSAVFLSSGVSGGSLGLAVSRGEKSLDELEDMARPTALAAALAGTLVGDLVAGSSGLRIPSYVDDDWTPDVPGDAVQWRDRAGLMETLGEHNSDALSQPFDGVPAGRGGILVLNSTDARTGCRVLVSQVDLKPEPATGDEEETSADTGRPVVPDPLCRGAGTGLAASIDLFEVYRDCSPAMTWATATMLSARFPTVTPAGRVPSGPHEDPEHPCAKAEELQLVDGGYAESSGLGTLTDLAPAILQPVLQHNATKAEDKPLVVPVVLYLEDEPRTEIARGAPRVIAEVLVPWEGQVAKTVQTSTATLLQRAGAAYADPCGDDAAHHCATATRELHEMLGNGVVVAAPLTRPAVEVPLGWTLSDDSRGRQREDLKDLSEKCLSDARPADGEPAAGDRVTYACMKRLIAVLGQAG